MPTFARPDSAPTRRWRLSSRLGWEIAIVLAIKLVVLFSIRAAFFGHAKHDVPPPFFDAAVATGAVKPPPAAPSPVSLPPENHP